jgi:hypothetical protein
MSYEAKLPCRIGDGRSSFCNISIRHSSPRRPPTVPDDDDTDYGLVDIYYRELHDMGMEISAKKTVCMRIGPGYQRDCTAITVGTGLVLYALLMNVGILVQL